MKKHALMFKGHNALIVYSKSITFAQRMKDHLDYLDKLYGTPNGKKEIIPIQHHYYKAKINYHRTDDLKENVPDNGDEIIVRYMWIAEPEEAFAGEVVFGHNKYLWIPQRDLILLREATFEEYVEDGTT